MNEEQDPSFKSNSSKIFVFGSNTVGRHGKGAALWALKNRGAKYGQGFGLQGNSFAIPTKDANIRTLPLDIIKSYVMLFLEEARSNPELEYEVTPIGCGLAGYLPDQIAPMFKDSPPNVELPQVFKQVLENK